MDSDSGVFWLHDLLPLTIPSSRILSFGYDASSTTNVAVEDIAFDLLGQFVNLRTTLDWSGFLESRLHFLSSASLFFCRPEA